MDVYVLQDHMGKVIKVSARYEGCSLVQANYSPEHQKKMLITNHELGEFDD